MSLSAGIMRAGAAVVLVLFAVADAVPASAEIFRYRFRPGQVMRSRVELAGASMVGPAGEQMMRARFRSTLTEVARVTAVSGGVATLDITETPASNQTDGPPGMLPLAQGPTRRTLRIDTRGRVLGYASKDGESEDEDPLDVLNYVHGVVFPDGDIKPGHRWQETVGAPGHVEERRIVMSCRFVGWVRVKGRRCAEFSTTFTVPMHEAGDPAANEPSTSGRVRGAATIYFDPAAGEEVYSSGSMVLTTRTDLSSLGPEGGDFLSVTKINFVQAVTIAARKSPERTR